MASTRQGNHRHYFPVSRCTLTFFVFLASSEFIGLPQTAAASGAPESISNTDQLALGQLYEHANRLGDAEVAYRKALESIDPGTRAAALESLKRLLARPVDGVAVAAATAQAGQTLEANDRLADARALNLDAIKAGDNDTRRMALEALKRIASARGDDGYRELLAAADLLIAGRHWDDAETLARQALLSGSAVDRRSALLKIREIEEKRESFLEKQLVPLRDAFIKTVIPLAIFIVIYLIANPVAKWAFRRRQQSFLAIRGFDSSPNLLVPMVGNFDKTLELTHRRMTEYYEFRAVVGDAGKMPAILGTETPTLVEIVTEASKSAFPWGKWYAQVSNQPKFTISGWTEASWSHVKLCAQLRIDGKGVDQWVRTSPIDDWFDIEQDLAYEILTKVKKYADDNPT